MPIDLVRLRVPSLATHVRRVHQEIMAQLRGHGLPEALQHRIELALAETMNNIVEHAYGQQDLAHFTVQVKKRRNAFYFRFEDEGLPMPSLQIPSGLPQDLTVSQKDLPEGGFGWVMIRKLTDQLEYRREAGINILAFRVCGCGCAATDEI